MTSDKGKSKAAAALQYALGKERVSLCMLTPEEFDEFLKDSLKEVNLRELRGFRPLKDVLSRRPGSFVTGQRQNPTENVEIGSGVTVKDDYPHGDRVTPGTHMVSVHRGTITSTTVYRRYESEEETTDWKVADNWKGGGYVRRVDEWSLFLRRPADHSYADRNLYELHYALEKVPHEDRMEVVSIRASHVPLDRFRERFPLRYARVAQWLVWELASLARVTLKELESQATYFQTKVAELEQRANAISE